MTTKTGCGCRINYNPLKSDADTITYCPRHASVEGLVEAVKQAESMLLSIWENRIIEADSKEGRLLERLEVALRAALP